MGFGTGHHATIRLCLAAIQTVDLTDAFVLDVGTGSGVLAIAAARLGAARALGIDSDADAIGSARQNLALNAGVRHVAFEVADLSSTELPAADVVAANLTGSLLVRAAAPLAAAVRPGGTLILGGFLAHERERVRGAFAGLELLWEQDEDEWVGFALRLPLQAKSNPRPPNRV
jgi:ribosomal protein L11 methyltransferase